MFEDYKDIFNQRGNLYHQAMLDYPNARKKEFEAAIDLLDLADGQILCDVPSGGGYINNFIDKTVKVISVETSSEFIRCAKERDRISSMICEEVSNVPLTSETIDRVVSLAGLHHVKHQSHFFQETYRLLKPSGIIAIADVLVESTVDEFLNQFVDANSSMGHKGDFLGNHTISELNSAGFEVTYAEPHQYCWQFDSVESMVRCCKLLFGIDRADNEKTLSGIEQFLGYQVKDHCCLMNWQLYFVQAVK